MGADIAAGSQGEKGNKADLVIKPKMREISKQPEVLEKVSNEVCRGEVKHSKEMDNTSKASPTRFISIVNTPE